MKLKHTVVLLASLFLALLLSGCFGDIEQGVGLPTNAAVSVAFTDLDPDGGQIEGAPIFTPAIDESDVTEYRLYWGQDATSKLAAFRNTVIDTVLVGGGASFAAFAANTALPGAATHLLVFTANADGEMATGVSVLIVDLGVPVNAAVGVAFTDLDPDGGQIQGAPTFTPAADESDVIGYRLYWGQDATTKLAGNDTVIDTVSVGAGTSFAAFAANTALPAGATHLLVFTANADGEMATGVAVPIADLGVPFAYVTNEFSDNVSVISTSTNTVTATVAVGARPNGVAITPDGNFAYVANWGADTVSVIATAENTVTATVAVGDGPIGIAITPDGNFAYVANSFSGTVSVIATASNTVVDTITIGGTPRGVAITPDGNFAYLAQSISVSVIATSTSTVVDIVPVGSLPTDVAITPDGTFAYVANFISNNVSVIATASNTVTATVTVGNSPLGVAITPDGNFVYVTTGNVSVIATASNTVTATVTVGNSPLGVAITPDGNFAYVTRTGGDTVSVIATATNTVTATVTVGNGPLGVAITP